MVLRRLLPALAASLVALVDLPALAQDLPRLCQRGAQGEPVPLSHALTLEMQDYFATHAGRVTYPDIDPADTASAADPMAQLTFAQAIEWPGVLADRAAELPEAAHDLPWLVLLAHVDSSYGDPVWSFSQGPESILLPHLLPMLDRHGLTEEARILRMVLGLYPEWDADPSQRRVIDASGNVIDEDLNAALDAAHRSWPVGEHRAREAALRLIEADPGLKAGFQARIDALDDNARLDILLRGIWESCVTDWWDLSGAERSLSRMGSAQAALILMDSFTSTAEGTSLYAWFEESSGGHSEMLARLFDRRGLTDLADGLRAGMALFPQGFPREDYLRWDAMAQMDAASLARFDTLLPGDSYDLVRADMLLLARESGLLLP
jgi:hypothetical protein